MWWALLNRCAGPATKRGPHVNLQISDRQRYRESSRTMIERIEFQNFRVLKEAILPLGRMTLIIGPNGSGKSTALSALRAAARPGDFPYDRVVAKDADGDSVSVRIHWAKGTIAGESVLTQLTWSGDSRSDARIVRVQQALNGSNRDHADGPTRTFLERARIFSLDPMRIAEAVQLEPSPVMRPDGGNLTGILDHLRDHHPERFEALNQELAEWLPEFNRVLFQVPRNGQRAFSLRRSTGSEIAAEDLSDGTLLAFAILSIAYLPEPPPFVAFEEPDRGIHPRLLTEVRDALYRLAYPEESGERRAPVQVVATTHSPYLLDLFRDRPEDVVIAEKTETGATFSRLADQPYVEEILEGGSLGEIWYSGALGGVPARP